MALPIPDPAPVTSATRLASGCSVNPDSYLLSILQVPKRVGDTHSPVNGGRLTHADALHEFRGGTPPSPVSLMLLADCLLTSSECSWILLGTDSGREIRDE